MRFSNLPKTVQLLRDRRWLPGFVLHHILLLQQDIASLSSLGPGFLSPCLCLSWGRFFILSTEPPVPRRVGDQGAEKSGLVDFSVSSLGCLSAVQECEQEVPELLSWVPLQREPRKDQSRWLGPILMGLGLPGAPVVSWGSRQPPCLPGWAEMIYKQVFEKLISFSSLP